MRRINLPGIMARLHLHIGWPKTGTTALQAFCAENAALLAQQGLSYYASRGNCCGSVARAITKGEATAPLRTRFLDWLAGQDGRDVLISSEGFVGRDPQTVLSVFAADHWDSVDVIAYLRPQEALLEGWYKQMVKWGGKLALPDYLGPNAAAWALGDYRPGIAAWADWCNRNGHGLRLRLFQRSAMSGGDFGADFFTSIGRPDLPARVGAQNVSPSAALIGLYLRLPQVERLQQINRVMVSSGHLAATGSGDLFDAATIAHIRSHYAAVNEDIRRIYFPDQSSLFAPPRAARPAPDPAGLDQLLIDTLARLRGPDVAAQARVALA